MTTHLIAATGFIKDNPKTIQKLLKGNIEAIDFANDEPDARAEAGRHRHLQRHRPEGRRGDDRELVGTRSRSRSTRSLPTLAKSAKDAEEVGLLDPVNLKGIYDLKPLNKILKAQGKADRLGQPDHQGDEGNQLTLSNVTEVPIETAAAVVDDPQLSNATPGVPPAPGVAVAPAVVLTDVSKVYGDASNAVHALDEVTLSVGTGEFVCLLGASGCGKSTLLNILAGLDRPSRGTSEVHGRTGLMFQESALFPWLTVTGNVDLALKLRKVPKDQRRTPGRRAARAREPHRVREEAPARAVGRHATAGRAGACARAGRRRAAHGRAVRRARRHDPRPAARRARAPVDRAATSPSCSSPTTCAKRCASATASCCCRAGPGT